MVDVAPIWISALHNELVASLNNILPNLTYIMTIKTVQPKELSSLKISLLKSNDDAKGQEQGQVEFFTGSGTIPRKLPYIILMTREMYIGECLRYFRHRNGKACRPKRTKR